MSPSVGLTLGKFAPFHKGHQLLIQTALAEVEQLLVMVYPTEVTTIPLQVRAGWIQSLYPSVQIIEAWDGPPGYGDSPQVKQAQERYILQRLAGRRVSHFYCSEFYGEHVSAALNAVDRRVDEARSAVPVSGTAIRSHPYAYRHFLDPLVYRDLITKVCFVGAPSTGKTTLARALADRLHTQWMPEYGADFWREHQQDRRISLEQFERIAPEHLRREDELLLQCDRYLFCDTCPITTYHFAKDYCGRAGPVLTECARQSEKRYDLFFLCDTDIPYHDTPDRSGDFKRQWFQKLIIDDLNERRIPFFTLRGSLPARMQTVIDVLARHAKFANVIDLQAPRDPQTSAHG